MQAVPQVFHHAVDAAARAASPELPEGFIPLREVRSLPLLGRWPLLEDRMPAWLPFDCIVEMTRRNEAGDTEAGKWIDLHRRASEGDPEAQRAMGTVFETGKYGARIDLQRALFWYWRASLSGNPVANMHAMRLKESIDVVPAALEDPVLLYPGQWRIMREDSRGEISTWIVSLLRSGAFSSRTVMRQSVTVRAGTWTYDGTQATLDLAIAAARGIGAERWEIQLLGAKDPLLFGRDGDRAAYVLQRVIPSDENR
jgi:TPR repeat protein